MLLLLKKIGNDFGGGERGREEEGEVEEAYIVLNNKRQKFKNSF